MKFPCSLIFLLLLCSCGSDASDEFIPPEPVDFTEQNEKAITDYITANELVAQKSTTGLHYIIENQGDGEQPTVDSDVKVVYKGYLLDGTVFDQSDEEGLSINLQRVIAGWKEGIPYFNEGGSGVLFIPAHLGYGSFDFNGIPGGSVLIFEVDLLEVI